MRFLESFGKSEASRIRWIMLSAWTIMALLQSAFTELAHDEAYYWMYSKNLAWGYMHQPPMVGVLVWLGYNIIPNELGVRLLTVAMSVGTLLLTENLTSRKRPGLFYALAFAIPLLHVQSFFVAPDVPLMFFTALFLNLLHRYIEKEKVVTALGLGVLSALMIYSKYHAGLTLIAAAVACLALLKRPSAWLIPLVCGLLIVPHILWQIDNQFITFKFHWTHRMAYPFNLELILSYVGGVVLVLGPFVVLHLFSGFIKGGSGHMFDRVLQYVGWIFLIFFLFQSFRGRVEPNWISTAIIPMLILAVRYLEKANESTRNTTVKLSFLTIILILPLRVGLMASELPEWIRIKDEFHGWKKWSEQLNEKVDGAPVVFMSNYRITSKYIFYSGGSATSLNSPIFGGNDYDRFSMNSQINNGNGVIAHTWSAAESDSIKMPSGGTLWLKEKERIRLYSHIRIELLNLPEVLQANDSVTLDLRFENLSDETETFIQGDVVTCEFYNLKKERISAEYVLDLMDFKIEGEQVATVRFKVPEFDGKARLFFAIQPKEFMYGMNHFYHQVEIRPEQ